MSTEQQFQHRGGETTRIEAFVDAAFAFALTLLVISFDAIPQSYPELIIALKGTPAFLASFAIITMFWLAHRNWSNRFGLDTTFSTLTSLALVFIILVYVYPLRSMMGAALHAMSNGWLPGDFQFSSLKEVRGFFVIYGIGFALGCLIIAILNLHAYQRRTELALTEFESHWTRSEFMAWTIVGSFGLISACLAMILPAGQIPLAGWCYATIPIVMFIFARLRQWNPPASDQ